MEEALGTWFSQYGLGGLLILLSAIFVWRGAWPFFTKEYWPSQNERANRMTEATEAIKDSTIKIEKTMDSLQVLQHSVAGTLDKLDSRLSGVEKKVLDLREKVSHIEEVVTIYTVTVKGDPNGNERSND